MLHYLYHKIGKNVELISFFPNNNNNNKLLLSDARLDVHARGFWDRQGSAFFDMRVFHPNAESYKDLTIQQLYRKHEDEKKRLYANRVLEVEQGTFTPLLFTTIRGMAVDCKRFHSRLAELIAIKKGEEHRTTVSMIHSKVFFALEICLTLCIKGSRSPRRVPLNLEHCDLEIEKEQAGFRD